MEYTTIIGEGTSKFEEKKSIFIGSIKHVKNEEECKEFIKKIREENKEARHNVFAYVLGDEKVSRYSDDKEPQGTAGLPILNVLEKNSIKDAVIVVTRYFGGILLGTGGLTRAYSHAAQLALSEVSKALRITGFSVKIFTPYEFQRKITYYMDKNNIILNSVNYAEKVSYDLYIEKENMEKFHKEIDEITGAKAQIEISKEKYFLKMSNKLFEY